MKGPDRGFTGFPAAAFDFFASVAADTSWEAVEPLQGLHEQAIRGPMCELTAALEDEFGPAKVYRLHRARNFWITQHAYLNRSANVVYGVSLDLEGLEVEAGWLRARPELIARYREAVLDEATGERLQLIADELEHDGYELIGETLRSRPRDVPAGHPRLELLRHRSLVATRRLGRGGWLYGPGAVAVVRDAWRKLVPLADWLAAALDGETAPPRGPPGGNGL